MGQTADELSREGESLPFPPREPAPSFPEPDPLLTAGTWCSGVTDVGYPAEDDLPDADDAATVDDDLDEAVATEEIRGEIEQTRAELGETLEELQARLRPSVLMEQAKEQITDTRDQIVDQARETVRDATIGRAERMMNDVSDSAMGAGSSMMDVIRDNPIPALMVGVGLGWLWMSRRGSGDMRMSRTADRAEYRARRGARDYGAAREYDGARRAYGGEYPGDYLATHGSSYAATPGRGYDTSRTRSGAGQMADRAQRTVSQAADQAQARAGQMADQAQDTAGRLVDRAQGTMSDVASQAQDTMGDLTDTAQYRVQRTYGQFDRLLSENPLAVGAAAVGLGLAVGLALPGTEPENRLVGDLRDDVMDQARMAVRDTGQQVQRAFEQSGSSSSQ